jgi:hypothetical protein
MAVISFDDSAILEFLKADIITAWGVVYVDESQPILPGSADELPRAFLSIGSVDDAGSEGGASLRTVAWKVNYQITYQGVYPDQSAVLADSRVTVLQLQKDRLNELLALLTAGNDYHSYQYWVQGMSLAFDEADIAESFERVYTAQLTFPVILYVSK